MTLSKRLQAIYDMVPYSVTADIGSDHGKLMIALFNDGRIPKGYAVENKKGPYNRLTEALKEAHIEEDVVPLFSDGITDLPISVSTIVLAGMGGETILKILNDHPEKLKLVQTIIVDAHTSVPKLRKEISEMGFVIADEQIVEEDHIYYEIIKFIRSDVAYYSENDLEFGPILRKEQSCLFKAKYEARLQEIDYLLLDKALPENKINVLCEEKKRIFSIIQ
ncbi:MAG: SAM-dependent methyltransferase [Erysipelotrichaceae bacterium]|nr:SAM-dependent methyltransferase [Erysipelotrichaceae bacterium]